MFQKSGVGKIEVIRKNYSKKDFHLLFGLFPRKFSVIMNFELGSQILL